jgi:hypothetical protein
VRSLAVALVLQGLILVQCGPDSSTDTGRSEPRVYAPGGKGWKSTVGPEKILLHLEGSAYEMGYQHGYLLADRLDWVLSDEFYVTMALELLEIGLDDLEEVLASPLLRVFLEFLMEMCRNNETFIPAEFRQEMEGIVDGAREAGYGGVTLDRVLMNNLGFDALLSIGYPLVTPFLPFIKMPVHACDGFIARGRATAGGPTLMARSWMMSPVVSKSCVLIERYPEGGMRIFDVSLPGFVGVAVGMNDKGIGIGMDMVPSMDCLPGDFGMGTLLTARKALQEAAELGEAVRIIERSRRGVSWLYAIGDGLGPEQGGAVVESSAHWCAVRPLDYRQPSLIPFGWPPQIEDKEDLVVYANHYLVPAMSSSRTYAIEDSLWRYETLTGLVLAAYGTIDEQTARGLLDYLHPPSFDYYHGEYLDGVRSLFDLSNLRSWNLFGRWQDPWVGHSFAP